MGHPTDIFLSPPDPHYRCAVCLDVFDDPVALAGCGHAFCRACLDASLRASGPTCPECRADVDVDADGGRVGRGRGNVARPVRAVRGAIGNLVVRCGNCLDENGEWIGRGSRGAAADAAGADADNASVDVRDASDDEGTPPSPRCCDWTGPLSRWPLHASQHCPIALVTCPVDGCRHKCPRSAMKAHVGSPACVDSAVASRVASQVAARMEEASRDFEERRRTEGGEARRREARLEAEKAALEGRVRAAVRKEKDRRLALQCQVLELQGANRALKREAKDLRKALEELRVAASTTMVQRDGATAVGAGIGSDSTSASHGAGGQRSMGRKRDWQAAVAQAAAAQALPGDPLDAAIEESESRRKKKRRKKKKKKRQHREGPERAHAVSTDPTDGGAVVSPG